MWVKASPFHFQRVPNQHHLYRPTGLLQAAGCHKAVTAVVARSGQNQGGFAPQGDRHLCHGATGMVSKTTPASPFGWPVHQSGASALIPLVAFPLAPLSSQCQGMGNCLFRPWEMETSMRQIPRWAAIEPLVAQMTNRSARSSRSTSTSRQLQPLKPVPSAFKTASFAASRSPPGATAPPGKMASSLSLKSRCNMRSPNGERALHRSISTKSMPVPDHLINLPAVGFAR